MLCAATTAALLIVLGNVVADAQETTTQEAFVEAMVGVYEAMEKVSAPPGALLIYPKTKRNAGRCCRASVDLQALLCSPTAAAAQTTVPPLRAGSLLWVGVQPRGCNGRIVGDGHPRFARLWHSRTWAE